jgi:hypothetical protein
MIYLNPAPAEPPFPRDPPPLTERPRAEMSTCDILSLVLSLLGISLVGFVLGLVGRSQARNKGFRQHPAGTAGWIIGLIGLIFWTIYAIVIGVAVAHAMENRQYYYPSTQYPGYYSNSQYYYPSTQYPGYYSNSQYSGTYGSSYRLGPQFPAGVPAPGGWNMDSQGNLTPSRATAGQVSTYPYPLNGYSDIQLMEEPGPSGW